MTKRYSLIVASILFLLVSFFIDATCGSILVNPFRAIGLAADSLEWRVFFYLHLPRALTALLAGVALSLSGAVMQTFFRNPLADPYILGVSSGACVGVACFSLCIGGVSIGWLQSSLGIALSAILGACLTLGILLMFSLFVQSSTTLLLVGVLMGILLSSVSGLLQFFSDPEALKSYIIWSMGTLNNTTWGDLQIVVCIVLVGILFLSSRTLALNAMLLGEDYITTLGVSLQRLRWQVILATGLLTGCITAFCGPITFIGMAVPHATRKLLGTSNHSYVLPMSGIVGGIILLLCDALSATISIGIPISIITSLVGVPVIIYVLLTNRFQH